MQYFVVDVHALNGFFACNLEAQVFSISYDTKPLVLFFIIFPPDSSCILKLGICKLQAFTLKNVMPRKKWLYTVDPIKENIWILFAIKILYIELNMTIQLLFGNTIWILNPLTKTTLGLLKSISIIHSRMDHFKLKLLWCSCTICTMGLL